MLSLLPGIAPDEATVLSLTHPWFLGRSRGWEGVSTDQPPTPRMAMYVVIALVWGGQVAETSCPESLFWGSFLCPLCLPGPATPCPRVGEPAPLHQGRLGPPVPASPSLRSVPAALSPLAESRAGGSGVGGLTFHPWCRMN